MVTTTSTPLEQQTTPENRVILKGVSWSTFKALLADVGDDRAWRIAYDGGVLEIRMPHLEHEVPKGLIESFIEATADELEIEVMKAGSLKEISTSQRICRPI
jgi:Uma2 family endonuclease